MGTITEASQSVFDVPLPDSEQIAFTPSKDGLPIFHGKSFEDHVEAWKYINESMECRLWALGAIAGSLVTKYDDQTVKRFAYEVRLSAARIYEVAETYRKFQNSERSEILSFHHHTIAARAEDPVKAISKAEGKEWSTRQLNHYVDTGLEPGEKSGINTSALAPAATVGGDLQLVGDRAMIDFLLEARESISALKMKCPRPKFVTDVLESWDDEVNDHLEQLELGVLKDKVIRAWKDGYRQESQLAKMTGIPSGQIHSVMLAFKREGLFEKVVRAKTKMGKGTPPWIWHLKGEPLGSNYQSSNNESMYSENSLD